MSEIAIYGNFYSVKHKCKVKKIKIIHHESDNQLMREAICLKCKKTVSHETFSKFPTKTGEYVAQIFKGKENIRYVQYCMMINGKEIINREEIFNEK